MLPLMTQRCLIPAPPENDPFWTPPYLCDPGTYVTFALWLPSNLLQLNSSPSAQKKVPDPPAGPKTCSAQFQPIRFPAFAAVRSPKDIITTLNHNKHTHVKPIRWKIRAKSIYSFKKSKRALGCPLGTMRGDGGGPRPIGDFAALPVRPRPPITTPTGLLGLSPITKGATCLPIGGERSCTRLGEVFVSLPPLRQRTILQLGPSAHGPRSSFRRPFGPGLDG